MSSLRSAINLLVYSVLRNSQEPGKVSSHCSKLNLSYLKVLQRLQIAQHISKAINSTVFKLQIAVCDVLHEMSGWFGTVVREVAGKACKQTHAATCTAASCTPPVVTLGSCLIG